MLMRIGLLLAAFACVGAAAASWFAGYPPETAIVRGVVAWAAIAFVGLVAEAIVAGTPMPKRAITEQLARSARPLEGEVDIDDDEMVA